jgi:perosamine synthetase
MKKFEKKNDLPIMDPNEGIVLFHPHIPNSTNYAIAEVLKTRWIGQGPKVEQFEDLFLKEFSISGSAIATGSGTDALHLSYLLSNLKEEDEVLAPVFTCTATNIPLLYLKANIKFVDVNPNTLNICIEDLKRKISEKTKAIVCVHYGGLPCDMTAIGELAKKFNIPVIEDAAHAVGAKYKNQFIGNISEYTMFSFQAIKHITTGDGGMLISKNQDQEAMAKRLRWFGIERKQKQLGIWDNDITEVGYKYTMTDISAAMGIEALKEFDQIISLRRSLYRRYVQNLKDFSGVKIVDDFSPDKQHACWLFTVLVERRSDLQQKLRNLKIESGQTHFRNDRYTVFKDSDDYPNMNLIDDNYLILPLHTKMNIEHVDFICEQIKQGW